MQIPNLADVYRAQSDDDLMRLAASSDQLTDDALSALTTELEARRISPPKRPVQNEGRRSKVPLEEPQSAQVGITAGDFGKEVFRVYRRHFWHFLILIVPAAVGSYLAIDFVRDETLRLAAQYRLRTSIGARPVDMLQPAVLLLAGYLASWLCLSISFAAVCTAVRAKSEQSPANTFNHLLVVLRRIRSLILLSGFLFLLEVVAVAVTGFVGLGLIYFVAIHRLPFGRLILSLSLSFMSQIALYRFALSVPALMLSGVGVQGAISVSRNLTHGRLSLLAMLVIKSVVGGYCAAWLPYWIVGRHYWGERIMGFYPWRVAGLLSAGAVSLVELGLFVGLALLYLRLSAAPVKTSLTNVAAAVR